MGPGGIKSNVIEILEQLNHKQTHDEQLNSSGQEVNLSVNTTSDTYKIIRSTYNSTNFRDEKYSRISRILSKFAKLNPHEIFKFAKINLCKIFL